MDQQAVYDLMRERLFELFGPGGSFRITLGRASTEDALFVSTVADTVAWDVASSLETVETAGAHRDEAAFEPDAVWKHIETELLSRRTSDDSVPVETSRAA
jgi:hypothetical protein